MEPLAAQRYATVLHYGRFSSKGQAHGSSEARQADMATAWAQAHGVELSPLSCFDAGLSGFTGAHRQKGALGALLEGLRTGLIPTPALVLVEHADRLSREPTGDGLVMVIQDLLNQGADIHLLGSDRTITRQGVDSDPATLISLVIELQGAHQFSARLSKRMLAAHAKQREQIRQGKPIRHGEAPRWIDWDGHKWVLNGYAATVRKVVELTEAGYGQYRCAQEMNRLGHLTPKGLAWKPGSIDGLIRSPLICGGKEMGRRSGNVQWDYYPAVISRARWEAMKATIAARFQNPSEAGRRGNVSYIGQGITTCVCGGVVGYKTSIYYKRSTGEKFIRKYVRCRLHKTGDCGQPSIRLDDAHCSLLIRLNRDVFRALHPVAASDDQISALRSTLDGLRTDQRRDQALADAQQKELISLATEPAALAVLARAVAAVEERIKARSRQIAKASHQIEQAEGGGQAAAEGELFRLAGATILRFLDGIDQQADREPLNQALRRVGLKVVLDGRARRMALQIGDGPLAWQPIMPAAEVEQALAENLGAAGFLPPTEMGRPGQFIEEQDSREPAGPAAVPPAHSSAPSGQGHAAP